MAENVVLMRLIPVLSNPQTGRLDAKRVAHELHLSPDAIACALERTVAQIAGTAFLFTQPDDFLYVPVVVELAPCLLRFRLRIGRVCSLSVALLIC